MLVVKKPPANAGDIRDVGWIPGLGRCPGGGNGNSLQHSCLENPMDKEPGGLQSIGLQSQTRLKHPGMQEYLRHREYHVEKPKIQRKNGVFGDSEYF